MVIWWICRVTCYSTFNYHHLLIWVIIILRQAVFPNHNCCLPKWSKVIVFGMDATPYSHNAMITHHLMPIGATIIHQSPFLTTFNHLKSTIHYDEHWLINHWITVMVDKPSLTTFYQPLWWTTQLCNAIRHDESSWSSITDASHWAIAPNLGSAVTGSNGNVDWKISKEYRVISYTHKYLHICIYIQICINK